MSWSELSSLAQATARRNAASLRQEQVRAAFGNPPDIDAGVGLEKIAREQRQFDKPLVPFHWELEFPEVFDLDESLRPQAGFDAVVGNPPFAGKNTIIDASPEGYIDWLKNTSCGVPRECRLGRALLSARI